MLFYYKFMFNLKIFKVMSKMLKKMKLNELQKENLGSKEMQRIVGGQTCGCAGGCGGSDGTSMENSILELLAKLAYCGCN